MSFTPNHPLDSIPESTNSEAALPAAPATLPSESQSWGLIDVVLLMCFFVVSFLVFTALSLIVLHRLPGVHLASAEALRKEPLFFLPSETLAYLASSLFMVLLVRKTPEIEFAQAIRWRWPSRALQLFASGLGLSLLIQFSSAVLPIPRSLPIEEFFKTPRSLWVLSVFGIVVAPFFEELFFRGFLFPVLSKHIPLIAVIAVDGLLFSLYHGAQLAFSWAPLLVLFVVGSVLTFVRAQTKSVASSFLVHSGYNAFIFALMFFVTGGFRHMEKLR